jgi:hypothetical protein
MPEAPNRGPRKCGTCIHYKTEEDYLKEGCKLPVCKCRSEGKTFGIALCEHYKPQVFLDHSNHRDLGGPITGLCEWKCPPILRKLLWGQWQYRQVNKDGSWCHCWEPIPEAKPLGQGPKLIEHQGGPRVIEG